MIGPSLKGHRAEQAMRKQKSGKPLLRTILSSGTALEMRGALALHSSTKSNHPVMKSRRIRKDTQKQSSSKMPASQLMGKGLHDEKNMHRTGPRHRLSYEARVASAYNT